MREHTFQSLLSNDHLSDENDEDRDKVLEITLSNPTKVGDGMGSYMTYKLTVKVTLIAIFTIKLFHFSNSFENLKDKHAILQEDGIFHQSSFQRLS